MSRTQQDTHDFLTALDRWKQLALAHAQAAEDYRAAHAKAFNAPEKGTDAVRKGIADAETSELRMIRGRAEVEAQGAYHWLIFLRGSAGETV